MCVLGRRPVAAASARLLVGALAIFVLCSGWSQTARAAPGAGSIDDPIVIDALPYFIRATTDAGASAIDSYECASGTDESGPELIYRLTLAEPAMVTAWVEQNAGVDVDVHITGSLDDLSGTSLPCEARGDVIAEAELNAGDYHVIVDSYGGPAQAGEFVLKVYAVGESWTEIPVGEGVLWRARRAPHAGGPQVMNVVDVDLDVPGVEVRPVVPSGCSTVAATAMDGGPAPGGGVPVAAINSNFFSSCTQPLNLVQVDGVMLHDNGFNGLAHGTIGVTSDGQARFASLGPNTAWPEVDHAQGGLPSLVVDGTALQGAAAWNAEGLSNASFLAPNPRTVLGTHGDRRIFFGTFDGRRAATARGLSLDELAQYAHDELGAQAAINLDGGGSTTMWIAGMTPSGVVNYPADAGSSERPDHSGARSVVGAVVAYAHPYNFAPRFQTEPPTATAVGQTYFYDADAIDLNVDDTVAFRIEQGPPGMGIDSSSGEVTYQPGADAPLAASVILAAADSRGLESLQSFTLDIAGGDPNAPGGFGDAGTGPSRAGDVGGACSATGGEQHGLLVVVLLALVACRRRTR